MAIGIATWRRSRGRDPRRGRARGDRQAAADRARPHGAARRRARPDRGLPGLAKTLIARSVARVCSMKFSRIQFTPDLMPSDVTGSAIYDQRDAVFRVPARPRVRESPPRRRDQPRPAEDAGGAARGDAGAAGDGRRPHASARAAVHRARDPEPDRVRGHLPAARGPARPIPDAHLGRLSRQATTSAGSSIERTERRTDEVELRSSATGRRCSSCSGPSRRCMSPSRSPVHGRPRGGHARCAQLQVGASPRGSLALLKLARCSAALRAETSSRPRT